MAYTLAPIPDGKIFERLKADWGIAAEMITQLCLGTGCDTGTFRADTNNKRYFLRLSRTVSETGIAVSLLLARHGIPAVAPILSVNGNAWESVEGYLMVVYPLIDGSPIVPEDMTEQDWRSLGTALRAVHDTPLPQAFRDTLPKDEIMFVPWGEGFLPGIALALSNLGLRADIFQQELAKVWSREGAFPQDFFSYVQAQGQAAIATSPRCCLCHSDFQSQNILRSAPGVIHLIDWEGSMWAPPEKDIFFIAPEYRSQFGMGYRPLHLNEPVMAYYRSNWLMQDLFDCVDRILFKPAIGKEEKQWALDLTLSILPRMRAVFVQR